MPPAGKPPDVSARGLIAVIIVVLFVISAAGMLLYQSQEEQIREQVTGDLTVIGHLKSSQIATWREDRLIDARVITSGAFFTEGTAHYLTYGDEESREKIISRFREMNESYHYDNVLLLDPQGEVRISLDPAIASIQPSLKAKLNESLTSGTATFVDFYRLPGSQRIRLGAIAPLILKTDGARKPVGAVLLSVDPDDFLYPLVQSWPVASGSAETLLVEREGDHVVFLNDLRYQSNTALNLTIPLTRTDVPAVTGVLGTTGAFTGRDYRNVDVISVLEPVPGSPWYMVAKVDSAEAFSAWRSNAALIIVLTVVSLAGAIIIIGLVWQRRQKYYYQALYAAETERGREEGRNRERMETLLHLADMGSAGEQELADFVLDAGCRLTDSPLAFIGMMSPDESVFDITAWSKSAMRECSVAVSPIHYPVDKAGIWAEAVRQQKPIIANDYPAPQPGKKGLPPGHVPVTRFVSVPIFNEQRIVMVCAVANKNADYTTQDVDNLTLLLQGVWNHLRKRKADEALRQNTTDLEVAYEEITATEEELRANYEELAQSQQALRESERKYRNLYQYAQVGLFETSFKDGTVVACNQRYADLAGFASVEDAVGKDIPRLYVNPEDRIEVGRILREKGFIEDHTVRLRNQRTGNIFWGQFSARFNYEYEVAEGTIIDITEQKKSEDALRESERRLRESQAMAHLGFWYWDVKTGAVEWSDEVFRIFHLDPKEFTPHIDSILALSPWPEDHRRDRELIQRAMESHEAGTYEQRFLRPDNSTGYYYSTFEGRYDDAGNLVLIVGTVLDITERKQVEAALTAAQQQYRELFENVSIGILRSTPEPEGTFQEANPATLRIFEADSREQFLSVRPSDLYLDPGQRQKVSEEIVSTGVLKGMEVRFKTLKGRPFWGQVTSIKKISDDGRIYFDNTIEDITQRKEAEESLLDAEKRFRTLVEQLPLGIAMTRRDAGGESILYYNLTFTDITGYTLKTAPTFNEWTFQAYPDPEYRQEIFTLITKMYNEAGRDISSRTYEIHVTCRDGSVKEIEFRYTDLKMFGFWTLNDITERKAAEDTLRETNEYLQNLFDYANAPIIVWDPLFRITRFNHAFEDLTGRAEQDVAGQHLDILFPEASREVSLEHIRRTVRGERWETVEIPILHVSGTTRIVLWNSANIVDPRGLLISTIAQGYDITDRKAALDALRQSEEKYRVLFTRMTEGSALHEMVYDTSGNPADYRILDVNPSFESVLGIRKEDVVGKTSREAYGVNTPPYLGTYAQVAATGKPALFEEYFAPMKKYFSISVFSPEKGRFATIFEDITERRKAEDLREHLIRELEQKNAELERFTYTVSHDLKSPLITIKGFAGLLVDDAGKRDPVQLKKDVQRIIAAADTMQELLADVLELSRIGRVVSPPEEISFGTIAREAVDLIAGPLAERGVWMDTAPDLPVVSVDHARIREVMVNLIENAVKFMGSQQNPVIRIGVETDGKTPVFFVQDNGIGIDPRYLERIFNLFERLDTSTHGTGIGLTIVRRIIDVHGGKIWAESEGPGKGTTFRFTLPGPAGARDKGDQDHAN